MRWLAAHTWLLLLLPLIAGILLCYYTNFPINLLADTEVDYLNCDTLLRLHLISEGQERTKTIRYMAKAEDESKLLLYLQKDSLPQPKMGDLLLVKTKVTRGDTLGDFDYGKYLRTQGIVGSAWAYRRNWQVVGHKDITGLRAIAERVQKHLHQRYVQLGIHGKELGILSALTLGYREELDKGVIRSFSASGAMHILAVSGLHTGVVWGIIIWIFTLGGLIKPLYEQRIWQGILTTITLIALWGYAFITGLTPSVMRSALMLTVLEFGGILRRESLTINNLAAAAVIILLINPLALWSVSFQLSFAAVLSLLLIGKWMQGHVIIRGKIPQYLGGLLIVALAAQLGTMPLSLYYFGQTSNYFALTNLIVVPAAFVLLLLGFTSIAFSWCVIGEWLGELTQCFTHCLRLFVEWIEGLPFSTMHLELSAGSVSLLYVAIACALLMMRKEKVKWAWLLGVIGCLVGVLIFENRNAIFS